MHKETIAWRDNRFLYVFFWLTQVRMKGLEPSRPKTLEPKSSASTNSATSANFATLLMIAGIY